MTERERDAGRSRAAILDAAASLFAAHGYEGTSLGSIAAAAGLARGTPSYFYGSKERLYGAVLQRAFADRQSATRAAMAPLHEWALGDGGTAALRGAVRAAVQGYLRFVVDDPEFVALVVREELAGGRRLAAHTQGSTAMRTAFEALRRIAPDRGVREFEVADAILVLVALTFSPASLQGTLMRSLRRDLSRPRAFRAQVELAVEQLMHVLTRG